MTTRARGNVLKLDQFAFPLGAVGDGVADDTAVITAALATGKIVVGSPGKVYGVTGNISLPAVTRMRDIHLKQLSPNASDRRTLTCSSATLIHLQNVVVDINGNGDHGTVNDAAGIWLASCNRVILEHCEVFGNGYTNGIVIVDCDDARIISPHIHDMTHGTASSANPGDDRINGLWLIRGSRAVVIAPRINDLLGRWLGQAAFNRYTRGITVSGTKNWVILGGTVENVDQGLDITGSENSERFAVIGLVTQDCYTWGMKCANTVTYGVFSACQAWRAGIAGFVASPPSSVLSPQTQFIEYIGCQAVETGQSNVWQASANVAGFSVLNSGAYPNFPRNVRFIGCSALADGATMEYGFISQPTGPGGVGDQWVEVVDCTVSGATVRDYDGLHQGIMRKSRSAVQSLTHNTVTSISMDGTAVDRMGTGSNATDHTILRSGTYQISGYVEFAANATGVRQARILRNGVLVGKASLPATAAGGTCCAVSATVECEKNDIVVLQGFQDSGGALNVTEASLQVALLRPGRGRT